VITSALQQRKAELVHHQPFAFLSAFVLGYSLIAIELLRLAGHLVEFRSATRGLYLMSVSQLKIGSTPPPFSFFVLTSLHVRLGLVLGIMAVRESVAYALRAPRSSLTPCV